MVEILKRGNQKEAEKAKALTYWWVGSEHKCEECSCVFKLTTEDKNKICFIIYDSDSSGILLWGYYVDCPTCEQEVEIYTGENTRYSLGEIGQYKEEKRIRLEQEKKDKDELGKSILCQKRTVQKPETMETYKCIKCGATSTYGDNMNHKEGCQNKIS